MATNAGVKGLPQVASFRMKLGAGQATSQSLEITGRQNVMVDRVAAFLVVEPLADGTMPSRDEVRQAERLVRMRLALDRHDGRVLTIGDLPVAAFSQLDQGPVPVPPFVLQGNDQPTVKVDVPANLLQGSAFMFGAVHLEIVFWGQGA